MEPGGSNPEVRLAMLERSMHELLGNGKAGVIEEIRRDLATMRETVLKAKFVFLGMFVGLMVMLFLTGSGVVSLKQLIEVLK